MSTDLSGTGDAAWTTDLASCDVSLDSHWVVDSAAAFSHLELPGSAVAEV